MATNGMAETALDLSKVKIANSEVVKLLEGALIDAREGKIISVALIMVTGRGSMQCAATGGSPLEFVAGSEVLKSSQLVSMSGKPSPILRMHG